MEEDQELEYDLFRMHEAILNMERLPSWILEQERTTIEQYLIRLHNLLRRQRDENE